MKHPLCLLLLCLALVACAAREEPFDILIAGGMVYAGADVPPEPADVGIVGERIAAVGRLDGRQAGLVIDAAGLAVVPGFVDIHSHAVRDDPGDGIFRWPDAENLIRQGVTSVVSGPDGSSPLPITATFEALTAKPAAINFATFVGHGSIRERVMGDDDRAPTGEELVAMRAEVAEAMEAGAFGLSSGLIYPPGRFATTDEVVALAEVAAGYGGIYISHMREEGLGLLSSVAETIRIGEEARLPAQITHHKVVGAPMWGRSVDSLRMIDAALSRGVDVSIDQYPYTASASGLTILFPGWSLDGGRAALLERLGDPATRARLRADIEHRIEVDRGGNDPANIVVTSCSHDSALNGKNLAELLEFGKREVSNANAAELLMELVAAGECRGVYHAMQEEDIARIMAHPVTMISSDGGVEGPSQRVPHPRNYGTFARVLGRYVRERELMPLHTAIYKMSTLPADRLGWHDRGRIGPGAFADVAVLDPETVIDTATFENPHQYALGMRHVFVAGVPVLLNGRMTGARPGRIIRSTDYRPPAGEPVQTTGR